MTAFTAALTDTADVTDVVVGRLVFARARANTVGVTDTFTRQASHPRAFSDTAGITAAITRRQLLLHFPNTVGIPDYLRRNPTGHRTDTVGITDTVVVHGIFVQFDSWRPVTSPDNGLVLVCRTPLGEHDSYTGLTHLVLWTVLSDGTMEHPVVGSPADNGYGWMSYAHPEWSPTGDDVVVAVETSTTYKLVVLDATGFGS